MGDPHQGTQIEAPARHLPNVRAIALSAPINWLLQGASDFVRAGRPCLVYGLAVAALSFAIAYSLVVSNLSFWALALTCGFVFVAPMLAMGLYEAGRALEAGERPRLSRMVVVSSALRPDVAYLGLALLLIYLLWGRIAQVVYGLSTYRLHRTVEEFAAFALHTSEGHVMLISGAIVGGLIALFTFMLVVVSAPMLLDRNASVFAAMFTSFRAGVKNFGPMMVWAFIIAALIFATAFTAFWGLALIFPWLGLASWRAYREVVEAPRAP